MAADPSSVPQSTWNVVGAFVGGILALLYGSLGWSYIREVKKNDETAKKVDDLIEEVARDYVRRTELAALEVKVAGMVSRRELIAYLRTHKEEQQRMHDANLASMREIREVSERRDQHAQEFRKEMRDTFNALALKVEAVATIQQVQGDQKRS